MSNKSVNNSNENGTTSKRNRAQIGKQKSKLLYITFVASCVNLYYKYVWCTLRDIILHDWFMVPNLNFL